MLVSSYRDVDGFRRCSLIGIVASWRVATLGLPRFCRRRVDAPNSLRTSIGLGGDLTLLAICSGAPRPAFSTSSSQWRSSAVGVAVVSSKTRTMLGRRSVRRRLVEFLKSLRRSRGLGGDLSPYRAPRGDLWDASDPQASRIGLTLPPDSRGAPNPLLRTARRWLRSGRRCPPTVC